MYDDDDTTVEEFAEWLKRPDGCIEPELHHFFITAAKNKWGWKPIDGAARFSPTDDFEILEDFFWDRIFVKGDNAWVSPSGEVIYVRYTAHDIVAEVFLGMSPEDAERKYARISYRPGMNTRCDLVEDALRWVERPTKKQIDTVDRIFQEILNME